MKNRIILTLALIIAISGFALIFCRKEEPASPSLMASNPKVASAGPLATKHAPKVKPVTAASKPKAEAPPPARVQLTQEQKQAGERVGNMFKWFIAYSLDHGGAFPPDLSAIVGPNYGFDGENVAEYLRDVIEYRGNRLTNSDPAKYLLMRYRIGSRKDQEVRLYVGGSVQIGASTAPIPEDAPALEPAK